MPVKTGTVMKVKYSDRTGYWVKIELQPRAPIREIQAELEKYCVVGGEYDLFELVHKILSNLEITLVKSRRKYTKHELFSSWPTIAMSFLNSKLKFNKMYDDHPLAAAACNILQRKYVEMVKIANVFMHVYKNIEVHYSQLLGSWLLYYLTLENQSCLNRWFGFSQNEVLRTKLVYCAGKYKWHVYTREQGAKIIKICDVLSKVYPETDITAIISQINKITQEESTSVDSFALASSNASVPFYLPVSTDTSVHDDMSDVIIIPDDLASLDDNTAVCCTTHSQMTASDAESMESTAVDLAQFAVDNFNLELCEMPGQNEEYVDLSIDGTSTHASLHESTHDSIHESTHDSIHESIHDNIRDRIVDEIYHAINDIILNKTLNEQQLKSLDSIKIPDTMQMYYEFIIKHYATNYQQVIEQIRPAVYNEIEQHLEYYASDNEQTVMFLNDFNQTVN